jgi:beta-glucosidase
LRSAHAGVGPVGDDGFERWAGGEAEETAVAGDIGGVDVAGGDDGDGPPLDWVGFHYYTRRIVSDASQEQHFGGSFSGTEIEGNTPGGRDPYTRIRAAMPTEGPLTDSGLEIWPGGIYDLVTQISKEYDHPIIEITESGCGYLDGPYDKENGGVPDVRRIQWFRQVLAELARAIADGARVRAYHAWSLLDNFEWADGYTERYGLIHTDFRSQKRTIKDSGLWYGRVAASNRLDA